MPPETKIRNKWDDIFIMAVFKKNTKNIINGLKQVYEWVSDEIEHEMSITKPL